MFTIGSIEWPRDTYLAIRLYLGYILLVIDTLGVDFSGYKNDPVHITKLFLDGRASEFDRESAARVWWDYIDSQEAVRDFQCKEVLMGRLAICMLSVTEKDSGQLGDSLSWFLEVLGFLGEDVDRAVAVLEEYFK